MNFSVSCPNQVFPPIFGPLNLKRLQKLLKDNEKATENLLKALESVQIVDIIAGRIAEKKKAHTEIEQQIYLENIQHPTPIINEVRFFMEQFKKGDINDIKYRQALVDTFINKIYLYDDKMTILYNIQDSHSNVDLDEISSTRVGLSEVYEIDALYFGCKNRA